MISVTKITLVRSLHNTSACLYSFVLFVVWLPSLGFLLFSGNEPQPQGNGSEDQGPSYSGGASVGGPGGDGRAADPFAMMSEETRRLQCKCMFIGL